MDCSVTCCPLVNLIFGQKHACKILCQQGLYADNRLPKLDVGGKAIQARNPRFDGLALSLTKQQIRFKLDETGAALKSESFVFLGRPRFLVFNKPFLIMIQRKGSKVPYFALWVANAELLVPFE